MKTYYLCDLTAKVVLSAGELPETFANRIMHVAGLEDSILADLGQVGVDGYGFMAHAAALEAGMDPTSLESAHAIVKLQAWEPIQEERDHRYVTSGWPTDGLWFHSDQASRQQYTTYLQVAAENQLADDYVLRKGWKTMGGALVDMTVALLRRVRAAGIKMESDIYDAAVAHRAAMEEAEDPLGYDFTNDWPEVFTGV